MQSMAIRPTTWALPSTSWANRSKRLYVWALLCVEKQVLDPFILYALADFLALAYRMDTSIGSRAGLMAVLRNSTHGSTMAPPRLLDSFRLCMTSTTRSYWTLTYLCCASVATCTCNTIEPRATIEIRMCPTRSLSRTLWPPRPCRTVSRPWRREKRTFTVATATTRNRKSSSGSGL
jgi:hypothetical protein